MDNFTKLLTNILDCGTDDLELLKRAECDWNYVINRYLDGYLDFDSLVSAANEYGIECVIEERIHEEIVSCAMCDEELEALEGLCPREDFLLEVNGAATRTYLSSNADIYFEYLPDALREYERMTGIGICS